MPLLSVPPLPPLPVTQRDSGGSPAGSVSQLLGVSGHLKSESRKKKDDFLEPAQYGT